MDRNTNFNLYRTLDPKFTTYQGDGSGRDTYIVFSDGGFQPEPKRKGLAAKQDFTAGSKVGKDFVYQQLVRPAQRIAYSPDGTGRDTYIIANHGGTCFNYKQTPQIDFGQNQFLRDNNSPFLTPKMDKLRDQKIPSLKTYTNWPSSQAVAHNNNVFKSQRKSIDKLSPRSPIPANDPISQLVDENRAANRAQSVLRSTAAKLDWNNKEHKKISTPQQGRNFRNHNQLRPQSLSFFTARANDNMPNKSIKNHVYQSMEKPLFASIKKRVGGTTPNLDAITMASTKHHQSRLGQTGKFDMSDFNKKRAALGLMNKRKLDPLQFSSGQKANERMYNTQQGFNTVKQTGSLHPLSK